MLVRIKIAGVWYGKSFRDSVAFAWYSVNKDIESVKIIKVAAHEQQYCKAI